MGCKLGFAAEGVGLSGLSLGIVAVAVGRGSEVSVYKVACSGSTAGFTNCSTLAAMECPDLPSDLESRIVRFKLEGGIGVDAAPEGAGHRRSAETAARLDSGRLDGGLTSSAPHRAAEYNRRCHGQ